MRGYLAKPDTRITLAVTGQDAPVGYAMICAPDLEGFELREGDTELKRIYLFSRFRPGGNGQRLLDAALADAREMGCRRMLLGTNAGNSAGDCVLSPQWVYGSRDADVLWSVCSIAAT